MTVLFVNDVCSKSSLVSDHYSNSLNEHDQCLGQKLNIFLGTPKSLCWCSYGSETILLFCWKRTIQESPSVYDFSCTVIVFEVQENKWFYYLYSAVPAVCNYVNNRLVCRNATRLITAAGNIQSPEFPDKDYPTNVDCVWQITTPLNTRMQFKIITMSIQSCGKSETPDFCSCDYLEIRDGSSSSDKLLATLCGSRSGNDLPEPIYSSGRHLWVRFKSDEEVVSFGFAASFSSETIRKGERQGVLATCLSNRSF